MNVNACRWEWRKYTVLTEDVFATAVSEKSMLTSVKHWVLDIFTFSIIFRIVRAFLIEEQKIVAKVLKAQQAAVKSSKSKV